MKEWRITTSFPLIVQKNDRPIPSWPFARISKRPFPNALVYGIPREGPNCSIISTIWRKFASIPFGKDRVILETFSLKNDTFQLI
jgi:hypothetical protein